MPEFYVITPTGKSRPEVGTKVHAFVGAANIHVYVYGWYNETCDVYKVAGQTVIGSGRNEDVQIFMREEPFSDYRVTVRTVDINVTTVELVGAVYVTKNVDGSVQYCYSW